MRHNLACHRAAIFLAWLLTGHCFFDLAEEHTLKENEAKTKLSTIYKFHKTRGGCSGCFNCEKAAKAVGWPMKNGKPDPPFAFPSKLNQSDIAILSNHYNLGASEAPAATQDTATEEEDAAPAPPPPPPLSTTATGLAATEEEADAGANADGSAEGPGDAGTAAQGSGEGGQEREPAAVDLTFDDLDFMAAGPSGDEEAPQATDADDREVVRMVEREKVVSERRTSGYTAVGAVVASRMAAGEEEDPATDAGGGAGHSGAGGASSAAPGAADQGGGAGRMAVGQKRQRQQQQEVELIEEPLAEQYVSQGGRIVPKKVKPGYIDTTKIILKGDRRPRGGG